MEKILRKNRDPLQKTAQNFFPLWNLWSNCNPPRDPPLHSICFGSSLNRMSYEPNSPTNISTPRNHTSQSEFLNHPLFFLSRVSSMSINLNIDAYITGRGIIYFSYISCLFIPLKTNLSRSPLYTSRHSLDHTAQSQGQCFQRCYNNIPWSLVANKPCTITNIG